MGLGPQPPPQDQFHLFPSQFHLPLQALTGLFVGLLQAFQVGAFHAGGLHTGFPLGIHVGLFVGSFVGT